MLLNEHCFGKTRVQVSVRTLDFDTGRILHDPAHAPMLLAPHGVAVLRQTAFQVDCFADVNQFGFSVVNEIDPGETGRDSRNSRAELSVEYF
jgi:hypothetical protein